MRSIKELFHLMLDNQEEYNTSICGWIYNLNSQSKITSDEYRRLHYYIKSNRPSKFSSLSAFKSRKSSYYWPKNDIKPRLRWIIKQIKNYDKNHTS
jgi:hypothetical protein